MIDSLSAHQAIRVDADRTKPRGGNRAWVSHSARSNNCSHLGATSGAGETGLRTSFGIKLTLGLPFAQHNLAPFVASPFQFTWKSSELVQGTGEIRPDGQSSLRHPICRVFDWKQRLKAEKELTQAQIAQQEGLSKARVTQMFTLLRLPKEAQDYLAALTAPELIRAFSVRQLRVVAQMPAALRREAFAKMRADCERPVHDN